MPDEKSIKNDENMGEGGEETAGDGDGDQAATTDGVEGAGTGEEKTTEDTTTAGDDGAAGNEAKETETGATTEDAATTGDADTGATKGEGTKGADDGAPTEGAATTDGDDAAAAKGTDGDGDGDGSKSPAARAGEPTDAPVAAKPGEDGFEIKETSQGGDTSGLGGEGGEKSEERKKSPIEEKYSEILDYNEDEDQDTGPPADFYYNLEDLHAKAVTSTGEGSTPGNFLKLFHSFGYECLKRSIVTTISLQVHPTRKYFAVGEKGYEPDILIFEYPSLKLYRICRLGTETAYAYLSFSPKGRYYELSCSTPLSPNIKEGWLLLVTIGYYWLGRIEHLNL
eukprot:sb/3466477/